MVKAPSFGGKRTKYTRDMPGSNLAAKKSPLAGRMVLKLRSVVTMAGIDHILGGQDGRVVKAGPLGGTYV